MKLLKILLFLFAAQALWTETSKLTVQFSTAHINWNPHYAYTTTEAQIFTALYEGLTIFHPATLEPIPGAAEKWTISEDGLTITFTLRGNLRWSHGEAITAKDFKNSWLRLLSPDTKAEYASLLDDIKGAREYRIGQTGPEAVGIKALDNSTLIVQLKQPSPQFFAILCHYSFVPVHGIYRNLADWSANPSVPVNGPFVIRKRSAGEVVLGKNPYYWDAENIKLDELHLLFSDNPDEIIAKFNRFEVDWVASGIKITALGIPEALVTSPQFSTTYYYFSNKGKAWSNGNIRRALAMLLPWEDIRRELLIPGTSLVPPIPEYPGIDSGFPPPTERKSEALRLLKEAGHPDGTGLPPLTVLVPAEDIVTDAMLEVWQAELKLRVNLDVVPFPNYYSSVKQGHYDIAMLTWTGDYADPQTFLGMWTSASSFNEAGFSSTEFDTLIKESALLPHQERFNKLSEAEKILLHSGQVMPIEHFPAVNIIDRRFVEGWYPNVLDIHPFKNMVRRKGYKIPGVVKR
ncbi:MAG: hypothetical protein B0D92_03740 [Spirochaeta sp. LUC14_002_19_P3]|nr:MAG: hypothetical protein B0D92_03740 [Spirochaeta sp. LUC14_002_19_P3]